MAQVRALDVVAREQRLQSFARRLVLRDHHHAAGSFVEPMDDAGAQARISVGDGDPTERSSSQETVDQGPRLVSTRGMHDESSRLVDHHQMSILEENLERRRPDPGTRSVVGGARGRTSTIAPSRTFSEDAALAPIEGDPIGLYPTLHGRARAVHVAPRHALHHELVEPVARVAGLGDEPKLLPGGLYQSFDFTCPLDLMRMSISARS